MTTSPPPARTSPALPIGIGFLVVVLLAGGIAVAAWFGMRLLQRGTAIPTLLRADTHMYFTFTPNLRDVPHVERFARAFPELLGEEQEGDEEEVSPMDNFLSETLGVTFEEDVQPWVGTEMGVAMTLDEEFGAMYADLATGMEPDVERLEEVGDFYFLIQSRDDAQLNAFIEKVRAKLEEDGQSVTTEEYNGVTLYRSDADTVEISFANIKGHFVVTTQSDGLPLMIDRQEQDSLAATEGYRRVKENLPEEAIGYAYFSGGFYQEFLGSMTESLPESEAFASSLEMYEAMQGVGFSLTVEENGLRFDALSAMDMAALSEESRALMDGMMVAAGQELASVVGDKALLMYHYALSQSYLDQMVEGVGASPESAEAMEGFEEATGMTMQEMSEWLAGELLLVVLPAPNPDLPASGYLRLRSNNPDAAREGFSELVEVVLGGSPSDVLESRAIDGVDWQVVPDPSGGDAPFAGYAFVQDDIVVAIGSPAIDETGTRGNALTESADYRAATAGLPESRTGILYVNIRDIVALIEEAAPDTLDAETKARLEPFVAIAAANQAGLPDDGLMRGEMFIYIAVPE